MSKLLDNYIIDARTRYEEHRLIYNSQDGETIEFGGFLAASILAAFLMDTPEGDARGIAMDTDEQREDFFIRYEREVLRDDWGYLSSEVNQLHDNYVQVLLGSTTLNDICLNKRLLNIAMNLTETFMQRLVLKTFREHIWEVMPWKTSFPQWLIDAARVETK